MYDRVPYNNQVIMLECGILLHSQVIGLPYFRAPLEKDTGTVESETVSKPS